MVPRSVPTCPVDTIRRSPHHADTLMAGCFQRTLEVFNWLQYFDPCEMSQELAEADFDGQKSSPFEKHPDK
jgi:hypothetical protein